MNIVHSSNQLDYRLKKSNKMQQYSGILFILKLL